MRCYSCGCKLSEHSFCTNCGVDVALYKKIIRTSNYFYNQGLERAKVRDLSGAIVSLRQSLKFNKNNIKARNLLGLVYYEMGEVPAALSEWVISKNLRGKSNMASDYLDRVQSNAQRLDEINRSIKAYNKALELLSKADGVDLATIQLKQALKANGKFIRAHQLLALCYIKTKKLEGAKRELERAKSIDVNNTTTLRYLGEVEALINPEEARKRGKALEEKGPTSYTYIDAEGDQIIVPNNPQRSKHGSNTVLNIIFGVAIGFAITFFLVLPAKVQQAKAEARESIEKFGEQLDAKNLTVTELENQVSEQADKINALSTSLAAYSGTEGTLLSMENLLKASAIYLETPENFLEVADYIKDVDENTWTEDTSENYKQLYYALKAAIGPSASAAYYNEGITAHKGAQYEDAIAYLKAAVFFDPESKDALYQLAISYEAADQIDSAKLTYKKVIELFPDSWHSNRSEKALEKLNP